MSDNRDASTGQFVATDAPPLVGREGVEQAQGYVPLDLGDEPAELPPIALDDIMDGDLPPFADENDPRPGTPESDIKTYGTFLDHLGPEVSITLEQAAQITSEEKAAEAKAAEEAELARVRQETDALRGETAAKESAEASPEVKMLVDQGLDPEVAQALSKPQIREALETEFNTIDRARESYVQGLEQARVASLAGLYEVVPHLANLAPQDVERGLAVLSEVDPPAFQKAMSVLQRTNQIVQAQAQARQQESQIQYQRFENSVRSEDARLVKLVGSEKAANEANQALVSYLDHHGVPKNQRVGIVMNNPVLRTAEARETIWKAAQYDAMKSAPKPAKSIAPLQKPGTAQIRSPGSESRGTIAALERQLDSATGDRAARISAQIHGLQRRAR